VSGTWCDICIEQTLMKAAKSQSGLSQGKMRNLGQTWEWILPQSMSLNPNDYGWTLGVHGWV